MCDINSFYHSDVWNVLLYISELFLMALNRYLFIYVPYREGLRQ